MKITMDSYRDYLLIVRLLIASSHEPTVLNETIKIIDSSTLDIEEKIPNISKEFTLRELVELQEGSRKLLNIAENTNNDYLFTLMEDYQYLSSCAKDWRYRKIRQFCLDNSSIKNTV